MRLPGTGPGSRSYEVAANWKFAVENYIEPYHVFAVHPRLIADAVVGG